VIAYKFLSADGRGLFTGHRWRLDEWVEAEIEPCRSGVHACRAADLPRWVAPQLYEIELDGEVVEHTVKIVGSRGRLVRRIEAWDEQLQLEYSRMCLDRIAEHARTSRRLRPWVPPPDVAFEGPALCGYMAARVAEEVGGLEANRAERRHQATWICERLGLQ
jgi:hypothetical protein